MKVGIIYSRSQESGGFVKALYIEKYLSKLGHEVEFIKPLKRLPFQLDFPASLFIYFSKTFFKHYDIIVVVKSYPNTCVPAFFKKALGTKIILDIDDLDYMYREGVMSRIGKLIQHPFPRFFDAVTVHNVNLREFLTTELQIPSEKIFDLPQGVDIELFNEKNVDLNLRNKLSLENKQAIVYTAHLDVSTDLLPIFKAMKIVFKRNNNCKLIVAGGGPLQSYFEKLAKKMGLYTNVIFTGYLAKELLPSYIALGDVCIVYYENRPVNLYRASMKIREYLVMKRPVVCNDVGELKQFEKYTYQSTSGVQDFANRIIDTLKNGPDQRVSLGQKFIKENFSWEEIIKNFEESVLVPLIE